ncbi:MAG: ETC complex I subunit [Rhodospirillales bacterium]|nr:ETC complex I subunit [Rhodospirillales bacterium]
MTVARIYRPSKTAMQSGRGNTRRWILEFEPAAPKTIDPLMGWTGSGDMAGQVRLRFASGKEAIAYAKRHGLAYQLIEPKERVVRPKSYADNFAFNRVR